MKDINALIVRFKSRKSGFSLIEVMVALVIIALIIFTFTPLTVFSFKQIYQSGEGQAAIYSQQSTLEKKLSTRNTNTGLPGVTIDTIFKATTASGHTVPKVGPVSVNGALVSDNGMVSGFHLATVYTDIGAGDNKARIRLVPNSVSETEELKGKVIQIYAEFLAFTSADETQFKLIDNTGSQVSGITFNFIDSTTFSMKLSTSTVSVTAAKAPYTVKLRNDDALTAKLYVDPPDIIVACGNGQYYTSKLVDSGSNEQANFFKTNVTIAGSINGIEWNSDYKKYIAVGNNGVCRTLTGGNSWVNEDNNFDEVGELLNSTYLGNAYRNRPPVNNQAIGTDYNGIPVIGGRYLYQERFIFWMAAEEQGFLTNYNVSDANKFSNQIHTEGIQLVNDITTVQTGEGNSYTFTVGSYNGNAFVMARNPNVNSGSWFDTFNYSNKRYPIATGIAGGISITSGTEQPVFLFCTAGGKIYKTNQIVRHVNDTNTTNWAETYSNTSLIFSSLSFGGKTFVAVGNSNAAVVGKISSTDGSISWTSKNIAGTGSSFSEVLYINDRFYAVGKSSANKGIVYTSTDGETWKSAIFTNGDPSAPFIAIAGRN